MYRLLIVAVLFSFCLTANAQYPRRVYYQPNITWYPSGVQFRTNSFYNPYNRNVRIGVNFGFSGIQGVNTFNFYNGRSRSFPVQRNVFGTQFGSSQFIRPR